MLSAREVLRLHFVWFEMDILEGDIFGERMQRK